MKIVSLDGKRHILSRERRTGTELVDVENLKLRTIPFTAKLPIIAETSKPIFDKATKKKFEDRPKTFLTELRENRRLVAIKAPKKVRGVSKGSSSEGEVKTSKPRKSTPKAPVFPTPEVISRLKMMPKNIRDAVIKDMKYSIVPGTFES